LQDQDPTTPSKATPLLRLVRVGTLFSPGADVVAGLCLAGSDWSGPAVRAVGASILVYAAGMVLNDHADRARDALLRPERPIPRGEVSPGTALGLGLAMLVAALALSPVRLHHGIMAVLVLAYDYGFSKRAAVGAVSMGILRGLNLATGFLVVDAVGTQWPELSIACGAYGLYILAVTLLGIMEDEPRVQPRVLQSLQALPPLVAFLALLSLSGGMGLAPALSLVPVLLFALRNRRVRSWDTRAIRGSMTWLLLGTMIYTSLLCLAATPMRLVECLGIAAAIVPARWISRRIALT
jgi:4-hydroxybenzoate polyprenyltransferase